MIGEENLFPNWKPNEEEIPVTSKIPEQGEQKAVVDKVIEPEDNVFAKPSDEEL